MGVKVLGGYGSRLVAETLECDLKDLNLGQLVTLLLDYPVGCALDLLAQTSGLTVIKTISHSPYYLRDLLELRPRALLTGGVCRNQLRAVLIQVSDGHRVIPELPAGECLTPRERLILRQVALGFSNQELARSLGVTLRRVQNCVSELYDKLEAQDRLALARRYFGVEIKASRDFFTGAA